MPDQESTRVGLFAVLIGINHYRNQQLPDGTHYPDLGGCVRDVELLDSFFRMRLRIPEEQIVKLVSPGGGPPPPDRSPTYQGMVEAIRRVRDTAHPGDEVYIHYSGTGVHVPTAFPERRGPDGLDLALIPWNVGDASWRYLRDLEVTALLRELVENDLSVTLVLDCCFLGGPTRGPDALVRGVMVSDTTGPPRQFGTIATEPSSRKAPAAAEVVARTGPYGDWLPPGPHCVLLAACQPSESAYEYAFDGKERNGALTYWLVDALRQLGPDQTYRQLFDRIATKVRGLFPRQTPVLAGNADLNVFGAWHTRTAFSAAVIKADRLSPHVILSAGLDHKVQRGAVFTIYPANPPDANPDRDEPRVALVEVEDVEPTQSLARIKDLLSQRPILEGDRAVFLPRAAVQLKRKVRLIRDDPRSSLVDRAAALKLVEAMLITMGEGWVEPAKRDEPGDFQLAIDEKGRYEITDPTGHPLPNLEPPIVVGESESASRVIRRLVHLSRYHAILQLDNAAPPRELRGRLRVKLLRGPRDYQLGEKTAGTPFEPGEVPTCEVGHWVFLTIRNEAPLPLNVTVLLIFDSQNLYLLD